jgi:hypothetical protein
MQWSQSAPSIAKKCSYKKVITFLFIVACSTTLDKMMYIINADKIISASSATDDQIRGLETIWIGPREKTKFEIANAPVEEFSELSWRYVKLLQDYHGPNWPCALSLIGWLVMACQREILETSDVKVPSAQLTGKNDSNI